MPDRRSVSRIYLVNWNINIRRRCFKIVGISGRNAARDSESVKRGRRKLNRREEFWWRASRSNSIKVDGRPEAIVRRMHARACCRYPSTMMLRAEGPGICNPASGSRHRGGEATAAQFIYCVLETSPINPAGVVRPPR